MFCGNVCLHVHVGLHVHVDIFGDAIEILKKHSGLQNIDQNVM